MDNWLVNRLQPSKKDNERWVQLGEALQEFWETYAGPYIDELSNLRSIFTTSMDNLEIIIKELGDYFINDVGSDKDKPIQVLWRRLELQAKETESMIIRAFKRKFVGLNIAWTPVYAHKTDEYGTNYKTEADIENQGLDMNDFFLTSRGKISLISNWDKEDTELIQTIKDEAERILPTHIVYSGTNIVADAMVLSLYHAIAMCQSIQTELVMDEYIYPENSLLYVGGSVATGISVKIEQE